MKNQNIITQYKITQKIPIDQIEVIFAVLIDSIRIRIKMTRAFRGNVFTIISTERHRTISLPLQIEQSIGRPETSKRIRQSNESKTTRRKEKDPLLVSRSLDSSASLECPIAVLHGTHVPTASTPIEFQLERLVVGYFILVGGHVDAWNDEKRSMLTMQQCSRTEAIIGWTLKMGGPVDVCWSGGRALFLANNERWSSSIRSAGEDISLHAKPVETVFTNFNAVSKMCCVFFKLVLNNWTWSFLLILSHVPVPNFDRFVMCSFIYEKAR